jgi:hypothetical protein
LEKVIDDSFLLKKLLMTAFFGSADLHDAASNAIQNEIRFTEFYPHGLKIRNKSHKL